MNFLYTGEAVISSEKVDIFLETAKELQVKGLEYDDSFILTPNKLVNNGSDEIKKEVVSSSDVGLVEVSETVINEDLAAFDDTQDKQRPSKEIVQVNKNEELDIQVQQLIVKKDGLWECKICGKTSLYKNHMKQHTETHIEGVSHACQICKKTFANRHNLRGHVSGIHSELFTCDVCGKSGMNKYSYRAHQQRQHQVFSVKHQK